MEGSSVMQAPRAYANATVDLEGEVGLSTES
jgi:hypothetical protein